MGQRKYILKKTLHDLRINLSLHFGIYAYIIFISDVSVPVCWGSHCIRSHDRAKFFIIDVSVPVYWGFHSIRSHDRPKLSYSLVGCLRRWESGVNFHCVTLLISLHCMVKIRLTSQRSQMCYVQFRCLTLNRRTIKYCHSNFFGKISVQEMVVQNDCQASDAPVVTWGSLAKTARSLAREYHYWWTAFTHTAPRWRSLLKDQTSWLDTRSNGPPKSPPENMWTTTFWFTWTNIT